MKVVVKFLAIILFVLSFKVEAQNYFPFPDSNSIWHVVNSFKEGWPSKYTYEINGDTLMNGRVYNKLVNPDNNFFYGGIREDTLKRIYFFGNLINATFVNSNFYDEYDTIKEYLLYQFGLDVGDTISIKAYPSVSPIEILRIDSIKIDGKFRLRYDVGNYWIEGIGSEKGLFGPYSYEFENYIRLTCFQQNEKFIWPDTTGDCLTISVEDVKIDSKLKVYPNPTQNTLHIETSSQNQQIENIQIISLSGKNVVQTNQTPINTSELSQGIYFYQVEMSNGELLRGKFVKE